jgi:ATP-dependent phosphoenolpyruvate carboxykinase
VVFIAIPQECPNVPSEINPRNTWEDKDLYDQKALELGQNLKTILPNSRSLHMLKLWLAHPTHKLIIFKFKRAVPVLSGSFRFIDS